MHGTRKSLRMRGINRILSVVLGVLLFCNQFAFAVEPTINVLGDVVGSGKVEMKGAFDKWIPVSGKAFPVVDGATLRSGDGMMSAIFRDGARLEIGKHSEARINGSKGNYSITLGTGNVAFSVPKEISFSISTPNATIYAQVTPNMIQQVSATVQEDARGLVIFDGKGTKVMSVNGTLMIRDTKGAALQTVTAGKAAYIAASESGSRVIPTQLVTGSEGGGSALLITGGSIAAMGGAFLGVNSTYNEGKAASPSKP